MFFHSFCLLFLFGFHFHHTVWLEPFVSLPKCLGGSSLSWEHEKDYVQLPFSGHAFTKCLFCMRHCVGQCCGAAVLSRTPPTRTRVRVCLAPPAWPFLLYFVKTHLFLRPSSCCLSSSVYPSMGVYLSMSSLLITSHLIWPLLFINFLFSCVSIFNRWGFWRDREPPVLAPHTWPLF